MAFVCVIDVIEYFTLTCNTIFHVGIYSYCPHFFYFFHIFFSDRLLSVLRGHSVFSYPPQRPMTSDCEGFLYQILSITLFSYLNSWERASIYPFQYWVLNKWTTGTIFITSLVWRCPWLGIEPGTSRWYVLIFSKLACVNIFHVGMC